MLFAAFAPVAGQLFGSGEQREVLPRAMMFTVATVAGCDSASISVYRYGLAVDTVPSDAVAAELDDLQFATGVGPGPDVTRHGKPVYAPDLAHSSRWPVLAATAAQLDVGSALYVALAGAMDERRNQVDRSEAAQPHTRRSCPTGAEPEETSA
ncbi:hypothetical protein GCM10009682_51480 [Luedemannella flava]|uniref:Uncharacterized protein n=1 Tax=Luedemannella flava TaxID=349316 RepID=A0ABN2MFU7_9ACTN